MSDRLIISRLFISPSVGPTFWKSGLAHLVRVHEGLSLSVGSHVANSLHIGSIEKEV